MVWVPAPAPVVDQWSGYIDATSTGTGTSPTTPMRHRLHHATPCTFAALKTALAAGATRPVIYTAAVGKGRDSRWAGAVDGFRINKKVYDFEVDGVKAKDAK